MASRLREQRENVLTGGEKVTVTSAETIEKPSIQVRLSLIFPLMLVRFARGLEQIHKKMTEIGPLCATFGQRSG